MWVHASRQRDKSFSAWFRTIFELFCSLSAPRANIARGRRECFCSLCCSDCIAPVFTILISSPSSQDSHPFIYGILCVTVCVSVGQRGKYLRAGIQLSVLVSQTCWSNHSLPRVRTHAHTYMHKGAKPMCTSTCNRTEPSLQMTVQRSHNPTHSCTSTRKSQCAQ